MAAGTLPAPHSPARSRSIRTALLTTLCLAASLLAGCTLHMPGRTFEGHLPTTTPAQTTLADQLRDDVFTLAGTIGERNLSKPEQLRQAESFLAASLARMGYTVRWKPYQCDGHEVSNLEAELPGTTHPTEIVLIGAHYDSVGYKAVHTPGADDNASGCAGVLALARAFVGHPQPRTIRFVLFVNEEPPYFWTDRMGSLVYAKQCKAESQNIVAMLSLEMLGLYRQEQGTQDYPPLVGLVFPSTGDFIAFIGVEEAGPLVQRCVGAFRATVDFPSEGAALPRLIPRIASSDHWSFWKQGYPAAMVTDTAIYRNANYHKSTDTPDTLDYERMARVVQGLEGVVRDLGTPVLRTGFGLPGSENRVTQGD